MKNRIICSMLALVLCLCMLVGCGTGKKGFVSKSADAEETKTVSGEDKINVVCTIFPEYDWVKQITKGNDQVEVTMLLDKGVDLHSFQPTADDIIKVASCDLFIYVGGESDEWVADALTEATNKDMKVINLLDCLGETVKEEEVVEGMEAEEEEAEGEEEPEYDEHVWLSLKNAETIVKIIQQEISSIDPQNQSLYDTNTKEYVAALDALDQEYANCVNGAARKMILFGDRFPFRYLADDYGLEYYAAFVGCSAESEASFETITYLANKVDENGLTSILQIESADGKIAETIKENTKEKNQEILTMNSLQSTTAKDVEAGSNYLDCMKSNLEVLKKVLN